jgi:hypothetical protein
LIDDSNEQKESRVFGQLVSNKNPFIQFLWKLTAPLSFFSVMLKFCLELVRDFLTGIGRLKMEAIGALTLFRLVRHKSFRLRSMMFFW